ncbi:MAG: DUF302 domain-containing protein [Marinilabiliales bacterium]|nr:MAG: DUF302 domain-containing protein [Marinilabiliales bacterium]
MNTKVIIPALAGVAAGIILIILIMVSSGQSMMLKEKQVSHNFEDAVELIETTVRQKGWTIPAVHNMQATLANFGHDVEKMKIFEICHPDIAYQILSQDDERIVSSLLPCRLSVYEKSDGNVYVSWMNMRFVGRLMKGAIPGAFAEASSATDQIVNVLLQ